MMNPYLSRLLVDSYKGNVKLTVDSRRFVGCQESVDRTLRGILPNSQKSLMVFSSVRTQFEKKWLSDAYLDRIARMYPIPPSVNPSMAMRMNAVIGYSRYESTCMCTWYVVHPCPPEVVGCMPAPPR